MKESKIETRPNGDRIVDSVFKGAPAEVIGRFSSVVNEIRISKSSVQGPPYNIEFLLLTTRENLSDQEAEAVTLVQEDMEAALSASPLVDSVRFSFRILHETSMAEYFASDPIYLEHLTNEDDELPRGAEPPPQA